MFDRSSNTPNLENVYGLMRLEMSDRSKKKKLFVLVIFRSYYWYNHILVRLGLFVVIVVNLSLVLLEEPAVHSLAVPYWVKNYIGFNGRQAFRRIQGLEKNVY